MKIGSLFSGIGGLELGLEWSGLGETVWQVERDEFCRAILAKHWPNSERYEDVRTVGKSNLLPVDLICGGFPCQDVSSAGKGAGLAGSRSGLWFEYLRIVNELRPRWVVVENVASGATKWVDVVVSGLEQCGYGCFPIPLSAAGVGAPHERKRVFIVAANSDRQRVRLKPGRREWASREDPILSAGASKARAAGDPDAHRKPTQQINEQASRVRRLSEGAPGWPAAPEIPRVDDGLPGRLDRNRALGNAVVPQCAEVIGWIIRELSGDIVY